MSEMNPYQTPQTEIPTLQTDTLSLPLASPWIRLSAQIIDGVILLIILMPMLFFSGYIERTMNARQSGAGSFAMMGEQLLWTIASTVIYIALHWVFLQKGQTIGKRLLSIRIVRKNGQPIRAGRIILYRFLPVQVVAQVPCVGAILALVDVLLIFRAGRNTLHDDIADTMVVVVPPNN